MPSLSEKSLRGRVLYALSETEERTVSLLLYLIGQYICPERAIRSYEQKTRNQVNKKVYNYQEKLEYGIRTILTQELSVLKRNGLAQKIGKQRKATWKKIYKIHKEDSNGKV